MKPFLISIALILYLSTASHATPDPGPYATAQIWTRYYGQIYLGGDWEVHCELEQASWDPHYTADTCVAKSVDPTQTFGLQYLQMEYTTSQSAGSVWDVLPYPQTYTWPDNDYASTWWLLHVTMPPEVYSNNREGPTCSIDAFTGRCGCNAWRGDLCITTAWYVSLPLGYEIDCGYYFSVLPGDRWPPVTIQFIKCQLHSPSGVIVGACDVSAEPGGGGPIGAITCSSAQSTP